MINENGIAIKATGLQSKVNIEYGRKNRQQVLSQRTQRTNGLPNDKTNKMVCAPSEDTDQPGHLPSLIKVFTVGSQNQAGRMPRLI